MSAEPDAGADGDVDASSEPLAEQYQQRVTIDMDGDHYRSFRAFRLAATRIWHNLEAVADRVDVDVSTGQEGLHFVAWFRDDLEMFEQVAIRRAHQDDPRRIDMDVQRWRQLGGRYSDVLFEVKGGRDTRKERRFRDVYDALDYIAGRRSDHARMKRLAIDGHQGDPRLARRARRESEGKR
jgi:hypothetical protein